MAIFISLLAMPLLRSNVAPTQKNLKSTKNTEFHAVVKVCGQHDGRNDTQMTDMQE